MSWWKKYWPARSPHSFVLALGGGGSRGLAHLGVLEVLEEHHLKPAAIVGTSIGALFGAMYALDPNIKRLQQRVLDFLNSDTFNHVQLPDLASMEEKNRSWLSRLGMAARQSVLLTKAATGIAVADVENLADMVDQLCDGKGFEDIQIPLYITAVSFPCGECHLFSKGDLIRSISASMAIPGIFNPLELEGQYYVDGGLSSELPAKEARMVASDSQVVVAVNVGARPSENDVPTNVIAMLDWSASIKALYLRQYKKQFTDILIEPLVGFTQWQDFSNPEHEIEQGRQAALKEMPKLMELLHG